MRGGRLLRWAAGLGVTVLVGYLAIGWIWNELGSTISYEGYDGPALVSRDGRTVTVGGFPGLCFGTQSLLADETPARVALRWRFAIPNRHGTCASAMGIQYAVSVRLNAPLGSRALVDPDTGRTLPWFDARKALQPAKLPVGYTLEMTSPVTPHMAIGRPTDLTRCTQYFRNAKTGVRLIITQESGAVQSPSVPAHAPVAILVRGRQGLADQSSITWSEDGQTMMASVDTPDTLTVQDLIAIVDSAP